MDFQNIIENFDISIILYCILAVIVGYFVIKLLIKPIKFAFKMSIHVVSGVALLWLANFFIFSQTDMLIPINYITIGIAGLTGIPGTIVMIILRYLNII